MWYFDLFIEKKNIFLSFVFFLVMDCFLGLILKVICYDLVFGFLFIVVYVREIIFLVWLLK